MATYKKKASKKSHSEKATVEIEAKSTTAHIFKSLDSGASKFELWVQGNQKFIFGGIGVVVLVVLGWLLYSRFIKDPRENEAAAKSFFAQQSFNDASTATGNRRDSLYLLALEGSKGNLGFQQIMKSYSGTKVANLAHYSSGVAYLNIGKYNEAIKALEAFDAKDIMLSVVSVGAIGDAYVFLKKPDKAITYYKQAIERSGTNGFTTPKYLFKAALVAHSLGKKEIAVKYLTRIKDEFPYAYEAKNLDIHIAKMKR